MFLICVKYFVVPDANVDTVLILIDLLDILGLFLRSLPIAIFEKMNTQYDCSFTIIWESNLPSFVE